VALSKPWAAGRPLTRYVAAKFLICSAVPAKISSICISWDQRLAGEKKGVAHSKDERRLGVASKGVTAGLP
jgi:hypothetical protein